jgi:hypothetical protein
VRQGLLCQQFGNPPADTGEVEPFDPNNPVTTTRERFAVHSLNPSCAVCHQFIDEVGFGFEHFDAAGKYRALEATGVPVDASGAISGLNRITDPDLHSFINLGELSGILAGEARERTSTCMAEQFQRMMDGESQADACKVANTVLRWNPAEQSIKDLWIEMVTSQTFSQRQ